MKRIRSGLSAMLLVTACLALSSCGFDAAPDLPGRWSSRQVRMRLDENGVAYMRTASNRYQGVWQRDTSQDPPILTLATNDGTFQFEYSFVGSRLRLDILRQNSSGQTDRGDTVLLERVETEDSDES